MKRCYDRITLDRSRAVTYDNGMMRVPARISRVGIQEYRRADGSVERAYRPAEEVGADASVKTFDAVTLVNDHPYADNGVVTAENASRLSRGFVLNPVFKDGFIEADIMIQDAATVKAVQSGKVELSAGYFMDRDETPGVTPDGQPYDFVQRKIKANHVAIVDQGRAGPTCRLMLDASITTDFPAIAGALGGDKPQETQPMKKITIDGVEVEVSDLAATLILKERNMATGLLDAAKSENTKLKAQCDAAAEKVTKLETDLKDAVPRAKAQLAAEAALHAKAKTLAPELKCDGLDENAIKRAVCEKHNIKLDGKDAAYVSARFDILVEDSEKKNPAAEAVEAALRSKKAETVTDEPDAATKRKKMEDDFFGRK